jgi:hypothetical protein
MMSTKMMAALVAGLLLAAAPSMAVDGVIEINQARALAGGVTPTDTPGFPVTLDAPGSYRLTGNLDVVGAVGIAIDAPYVNLDLNGFALTGDFQGEVGAGTECIAASAGAIGAKVVNGRVRRCRGVGLSLRDQAWVEDVISTSNGGVGIFVRDDSVVRGCQVLDNGGNGILAGKSALVTGNIASNNGLGGIELDGGIASGNIVRNNLTAGITAQQDGALVTGNTVEDSGGLTLGANVGYVHNVLVDSSSFITNGISLGPNLCGTIPCP